MDEWRSDAPQPVPEVPDRPTPHEDVERKPDGVPHEVIGQTAFIAVMIAMLVAAMLLFGGAVGVVISILLVLIGVPMIVGRLSKKAQYGRVAHGPHG
jgi:predicted RND superfamily exporter protein